MEIIANAVQTVQANQNVLFTDTVVGCSNSLLHREGSGLVTLKGNTTTQCRARYRITFGGNAALPKAGNAAASKGETVSTSGTVAPISLAIAINGEEVVSTTMLSTPGAANLFNNISSSVFIDVPKGCCFDVSVKNIATEAVNIRNANLIVERVA